MRPVQDVFAATGAVLALTAILLPISRFARNSAGGWRVTAEFGLVGTMGFAAASLNGLIPLAWNLEVALRLGLLWTIVKLALVVAAVTLMIARRNATLRIGFTCLLVLSPFTAITFARAAQHYFGRSVPRPPCCSASPVGPSRAALRVVWIIFDEWDFRSGFSARPAGLNLANIDPLAAESLNAQHAVAPAGYTYLSVPSLLIGRTLSRMDPLSRNRREGEIRWFR